MTPSSRAPGEVEGLAVVGVVFALTIVTGSLVSLFSSGLLWLVFYQLVCVAGPTLVFAWHRKGSVELGLQIPSAVMVLIAIALGVALALTTVGLIIPLSPLSDGASNSAIGPMLEASPTLAIAALVALPAVFEELLFRGILLRAVQRRGAIVALLGSSLVFALFHFQLSMVPPLFVVGLVTGGVMLATGNVVLSIAVHAVNNAFVCALLMGLDVDIGTIEGAVGLGVLAVAGVGAAWRSRLR